MKINRPILNRPYIVLSLASAFFLLLVALLEYKLLRSTGGIFMYPLDDTFIHMAVAKTLAFQGTWGIAGHEFESASSSVLYTLLLAGLFKFFGVHVTIPFIVNLVAGIFVLVTIQRRLVREGIRGGGQLSILTAVIVLTPLPIVVFTGMEHTLQCLFSFLFIFGSAEWLEGMGNGNAGRVGEMGNGSVERIEGKSKQQEGGGRIPGSVILWGILSCAIRYEGLFLVAVVCVLLLFKRKIGPAFLLGFLCALPILVFGIYSISKGSYFLPNSVLLKSEGAQVTLKGILSFLFNVVMQKLTISLQGISTVATQHLLILLPLAFLFFAGRIPRNSRYTYMLILLTAATFLQVTLASTGWFYRYEAYLILSSVVLLSILLYKYGGDLAARIRQWPVVMTFLLFVLFLPMMVRAAAAFRKADRSAINIYGQQYQMAKFLHLYYDDRVVAANDIGAISYYKKAKNLDLWGLANIKVARSRKNNYWTPAFLDSLCRSEKAPIAVVFDSWFSDSLLVRWNKIATWTIPKNVICGDSVVSFYAIDTSGSAYLRQSLQTYQKQLPGDIGVHYY